MGQLLGYSEAQIAAIEQGRRIPRPDTIDKLDHLLEAEGMLLAVKGARSPDPVPGVLPRRGPIEETAVEFHQYAPLIMPGLLQTEEYARTMFTVWRPRRSEAEIEQMVPARLERHGLFDRKPAPVLSFVLEEAVLRRPIGGVDVLRGQLEHLLPAGQDPHVEIQVMPAQATDHACVDGPFTLMVPEGGEQVAYLGSQGSGRALTCRETVRGIAARYGIIRPQASSPAKSQRLIEQSLRGDP